MAITSLHAERVRARQTGLAVLRQAAIRALFYLLMILLAILFLFPFYTMIVGSFMPLSELFSFTPNLWPKHPTFDNYAELTKQFPYPRYLFNSFALAAGPAILLVLFCSLARLLLA